MRKQTVDWIEDVLLLTLTAGSVIAVWKGGRCARQKIGLDSCQKTKMRTRQESKMAFCDDYTHAGKGNGGGSNIA